MGLNCVLRSGKGLGLSALVMLSSIGASAEDQKPGSSPSLKPVPDIAAMYPVEIENVKFVLEEKTDVNTLPGLVNQSLNYTELELDNWSFYNGYSARTDKDEDFGRKGLSLVKKGLKRALNDTDIYQNFEYTTGELAQWAAHGTLAPTFNFILGDNIGGKLNHTLFSDIEGLDFEFGGNVANIRDPLTGDKTRLYGLKFKPGKLQIQGHLGGGKYPLLFQLEPSRAGIAFRDIDLELPFIGKGYFSVSQSIKATDFKPLKGNFSYDLLKSTTDANYRIKIRDMDVAAGVSYSTSIGNSKKSGDSDQMNGLSAYLVANYRF